MPAVLLLFSVLIAHQVQGQIVEGAGPPERVTADWYLDTLAHRAWHYGEKTENWSILETTNVNAIRRCSGVVNLRAERHEVLVTQSGKEFAGGGYCACFEEVIQICNGSYCFFVRDSTTLAWADANAGPTLWESADPPISHLGSLAFCATSTFIVPNRNRIEEMHAWGILATTGEWLIQPIFDAPFHFENGIAEVLYYGQKRKINEKGGFVDE